MPTIKKLNIATGLNVAAPTDLSFETSTNHLETHPNDAAFVTANGAATQGDIYLNTTLNAPRAYLGGAWRTAIMATDATDPTKTFTVDMSTAATASDNALVFTGTTNRVYTFPDLDGSVVLDSGAQTVDGKTMTNVTLDSPLVSGGSIDVDTAGSLVIGSSVGANTITMGGATSTVEIAGDLIVQGTTTTLNTATLEVEDQNILINNGGTDVTAQGAGLTVERTGTSGSLVYDSAAATKWKAGNLGSEVEVVDKSTAQALTNKTIDASLNTLSNIPFSATTGTLSPSKGGTGVSNNDAATLTRSGNHAVTLTTTNTTSVTLPTSGTLATLSGAEALTNKTIDASLNTLSNIPFSATTGILPSAQGGTGVNSTATFPTSGVVVTRDATETLLNKTTVSSTGLATGALSVPAGTTAQRPGTPNNSMIRYNSDTNSFEGYQAGAWSAIGGGGASGGVLDVAQTGHGFAIGDAVYFTGSAYAKAKADAANTAEVVGVVGLVPDANNFKLYMSGAISGLSGLTSGSNYFLSPSVAGQLTITEPTTVGHVSVPVMVATSATTAVINIMRGVVVGGSNVRTSIALANNATTTIQSLAAYEAAELTGWVSISATTPLKFYVQAQAAKNGAGTDWNLSYQTTGDTPPVGFSVTVTAAGLVQVTLPSLAGFTAASINFALNAPAVGTTFPLSVQASSVLGNQSGTAPGSGYIGETVSVTISSSISTATAAVNNIYDVSGMSITLGAGVWSIFVNAPAVSNDTQSGTGARPCFVYLRSGTSTTEEAFSVGIFGDPTNASGYCNQILSGAHISSVRSINTTTTYKVSVGFVSYSGTSATTGITIRGDLVPAKLYAIRIA